ncbi:hypothetical protein [Roseovarius sp. M141]|uniref:hypothetical protein n=1 Tax=Roseovarius sp. M141 TaxID=2583806 RepID=UPI0020CD7BD4|nr:hypothetical protein [Roseovarius sp. M141]
MLTLIEEIVAAIAVSKIVVLPGFSSGRSVTNSILIYQNLNRAKITGDVHGIFV